MPPAASFKAAATFAQRHAGWIAERLARLDPPITFTPGAEIPFKGTLHRLESRAGLRKRVWAEAGETEGRPRLCVSGPASRFSADVLNHLRQEALAELGRAVATYAAKVERTVKAVRLRDSRTAWINDLSLH